MDISAASFPTLKIKLKVAVTFGDLNDMVECGLTQRRAPKICMKNDPGRIDDRLQRETLIQSKVARNIVCQSSYARCQTGRRMLSVRYLLPDLSESGAGGTHHNVSRVGLKQCLEAGGQQQIVQRRQQAV